MIHDFPESQSDAKRPFATNRGGPAARIRHLTDVSPIAAISFWCGSPASLGANGTKGMKPSASSDEQL
jgi:hypothetical protein